MEHKLIKFTGSGGVAVDSKPGALCVLGSALLLSSVPAPIKFLNYYIDCSRWGLKCLEVPFNSYSQDFYF